MLSYTSPAVTMAEADAYAESRAWTNWDMSDASKAAALRRGQDYIAGLYNGRWKVVFDDADAPAAVKFAIIEAARRELAAPGSLLPDVVGAERVIREKVEGIEVQYADVAGLENARPIIGVIDGLLAGLVVQTAGTTTASFLARA